MRITFTNINPQTSEYIHNQPELKIAFKEYVLCSEDSYLDKSKISSFLPF